MQNEKEFFDECHYCRFSRGRTNIYGLATVSSKMPTCLPCSSDFPSHRYTHMPFLPVGPKEIPSLRAPRQHALVASATEVTALISSEGYWNTLTIPLNHETGKFEIISIDAFERTIDRGLNTVTNFIIAVAAFQTGGSKSNIELNETDDYCLRIYGASTAPSVYLEETLFNIGGSFQVIKLKAAPMHLSHINITQNGRCQTAIILSATDGIVHVYLEEPVTAEFFEVDVEEYFSILGRMSTARLNVLSLDIFDEEDTRVVVAGSQSGELHMAVYQIDKMVNGLIEESSHSTKLFTPITSVKIFRAVQRKATSAPPTATTSSTTVRVAQPTTPLNLLITCAIEQASVYHDITTRGLSRCTILPESNQNDSVLCSHVLDVDWDGEAELILGTYGRQLLIYKQIPGMDNQYQILWRRTFAYPIYRIESLDLNRDGLDELIVTTTFGVHIFQPNLEEARVRLVEVLRYVEEMKLKKQTLLKERERKRVEERKEGEEGKGKEKGVMIESE